MPKNRNYIVFAGLRQILDHMKRISLNPTQVEALMKHPMIGPQLMKNPRILDSLFDYNLTSMPEGTLVFAGPGYRLNGDPFMIGDTHVRVHEPYMQVECDFVTAKLIETPWLAYINYMSMVASKAARVVTAAKGKPVMEFGQRRAHPHAAIDAAYAAYLAGCSATSNVAAYVKYGIPAKGTMDHFAVMASEKRGVGHCFSEAEFFHHFAKLFPNDSTLLVDTYDTMSGIESAAGGAGDNFTAIRIDSNVSRETVLKARKLLDQLNLPHIKIFVSDGLDEVKVSELADVVDGFGVGENITCSPDSATGVGAVGKLIVNGYGKQIIKVSKGSGKMTLPGPVDVWRHDDFDVITLKGEGKQFNLIGTKLLQPTTNVPSIEDTRAYVRKQINDLSPEFRDVNGNQYTRKIIVSDKFAELTTKLAEEKDQPFITM